MTLGVIGKKVGMTQIFDSEGLAVPVTVIQVGKTVVTQVKTVETDGYNAIQVGTVEVSTGEIGTGSKVPANTSTVHYKVISVDTLDSCNYCQNKTMYTWEVYKVEPVYKVVTKEVEVPVYKTINVYETQKVPVYDFRTVEKEVEKEVTTYVDKKVPKYGNVTYYRSQTCTTVKGYENIKWTKNKFDPSLIAQGYVFTGNVKEV